VLIWPEGSRNQDRSHGLSAGTEMNQPKEDRMPNGAAPQRHPGLTLELGLLTAGASALGIGFSLGAFLVICGAEGLRTTFAFIMAVLASLVSALIVSIWVHIMVARPLREMAQVMAMVARGEPKEVQTMRASGELQSLLQTFAMACERVRERERQLERSRKEFRTLFEHVPSYIAVVGRDYRIVEMNRNFRDTFGGAEGDQCYHVYKKRETKCHNCLVEKSFQDGTAHRSEELGVTRDGQEIPYLVYTAPVTNERGNVDHVIEMSVDLRPLKALEHEKLQAERLATVGQTVASLAHGIKNILTGLEGGVYVTQTAMSKADQALLQKGWEMVERNIDRISHLVRDLLAYSRVGVGELIPTDPNGLAKEVFGLFSETANRMGIQLILELDASVGEVPMDPRAVHTCLANLLSNAIDACAEDPHKKEHRVILRTRGGPGEGQISLEVEDNGMGMDESTKQKLFQRFFSTKGTRGTGLGLMLTSKLVHEHGGTISVDSCPGHGSRFQIILPRNKTAAVSA
jgi:PAS domain S-box-containing protein